MRCTTWSSVPQGHEGRTFPCANLTGLLLATASPGSRNLVLGGGMISLGKDTPASCSSVVARFGRDTGTSAHTAQPPTGVWCLRHLGVTPPRPCTALSRAVSTPVLQDPVPQDTGCPDLSPPRTLCTCDPCPHPGQSSSCPRSCSLQRGEGQEVFKGPGGATSSNNISSCWSTPRPPSEGPESSSDRRQLCPPSVTVAVTPHTRA